MRRSFAFFTLPLLTLPLALLLAGIPAMSFGASSSAGSAQPAQTAQVESADEARYDLRLLAEDEAGGGDATLHPDGSGFITTSRRAGHWDLWSFDFASGAWTQLTDHEADDFEGRMSPDGTRVTFTSTRSGYKDVWVLELESGALRQVTTSPFEDEYPVWTVDGRGIIYTGGPWNERDFFLVSAEGGTPRRLSPRSGRNGACAAEPGGASIVCHRYDLGTGDVIRLWLDDQEISPLTIGPAWDYKPTTSADGQWIAWSRAEEGPSHVVVMPAAGGRARALTDSPFDDRWPTWADGSRLLLFHRLVNRGVGLEVLDRTSGQVRTVVGADERPLQATLHPSGRLLAYCAHTEHGREVRLTRVDLTADADTITDRAVRALPLDADACYPRFAPDGRSLAFAAKRREGPNPRWEVATIGLDGSDDNGSVGEADLAALRFGTVRWLTEGVDGLRGMDGSLDWTPDGRQIVFHADTEPFAANLYRVDVATGAVESLTDDGFFDESPSISADGRHVLFMSTRAGDWTWGFFRMSLDDPEQAEIFAGPDWEEKNFPREGGDGAIVWSAYDAHGVEHLVERAADGTVRKLPASDGARWPSYSADGRFIVYTATERKIEYWLAENVFGPGSPLLAIGPDDPAAKDPAWRAALGDDARPARASTAAAVSTPLPTRHDVAGATTHDVDHQDQPARSPVHLQRR